MGGLFGGKSSPPPPPQVLPPAPMPDKEAPQVKEAQAKAAAEALGRAGRASTIMTDTSPAGGNAGNSDSYASKTLGGG